MPSRVHESRPRMLTQAKVNHFAAESGRFTPKNSTPTTRRMKTCAM